MSLIAWYPLNGDLLDYSNSSNDGMIVGSGGKLVVSNTGKIGRCYERVSLNDSAEYIRGKNKIHLSGDFTMACWAYVTKCHSGTANGLVNTHDHLANTGCGINVKDISTTDFRISCNTGNGSSRTYNTYYGTTNIYNKWSHLAVTYDSTLHILKLIVNGEVELEISYTIVSKLDLLTIFNWSSSYASSAKFRPASKINDVRVYDNVISSKELMAISKPKVLHYKFNDPEEEPTENLFSSCAKYITEYTTSFPYPVDPPVCPVNGGSWSGITWSGDIKLPGTYNTGDVLSFSGWMLLYSTVPSSENSGSRYGAQIYANTGLLKKVDIDHGWNVWHYFETTITISTDNVTIIRLEDNGYDYQNANAGNTTGYWCNIQIEEKDHVTPFTKNSRQGIVYDSSGYRNHGTISSTSSPSWSDSSVMGTGAFKFYGPNRITLPSLIGNIDSITMTAWFKSTGTPGGTYHQLYGGAETEISIHTTGTLRIGYHVDGVREVTNTTASVTDGEWHLIASSCDGSTMKVFLDGVLVASYAVSGKIDNNFYRTIGTHGSSNTYWTNGYMTDFRIYAVALSEEDMKELYSVKGSVSRDGSFHCNEFVEDVGEKVTHTGTGTFSSLNEIGMPIRYIKGYVNGSTANAYSHWVEIQAYDNDDTNVALGKVATSSLLVDGSTNSASYHSDELVTVDLGALTFICYLKIWHYWSDGRTYHDNKVEVSADGVSWITVFDSSVDGEYAESSVGRTFPLLPSKASIYSEGYLSAIELNEV